MIPEAVSELKHVLSKELQERKVHPAFLPIAEKFVMGVSIEEIAEEHGLSPLEVSLVLERPDVQRFCDHILSTNGYMSRYRRINLATKVINKLVEEAEEYEAPYTKKDLLDWLKLMQSEQEAIDRRNKSSNVTINNQQNIVNLIQELLDDDVIDV